MSEILQVQGVSKSFGGLKALVDVSFGLPEGQMGNSEVGHMNLGAGRIVYQDLAKINRAVKEGTLTPPPTDRSCQAWRRRRRRPLWT